MSGVLFDSLIFGPVHSRRLGISLGINLLPTYGKFCSFNCVYCECGWTKNRHSLKIELPPRESVYQQLKDSLWKLKGGSDQPNSLTFAGNGEPTMHPQFIEIVHDTIRLRNEILPQASFSVLSNGSMLHHHDIAEVLKRIDNTIVKLDGGNEAIIRKINMPLKAFRLKHYVETLKEFQEKLIIQTLFLKGWHKNEYIDNTSPAEVADWLKLIEKIKPRSVMLYPIDRETPAQNIEKVSVQELELIAVQVRALGIEAHVYS